MTSIIKVDQIQNAAGVGGLSIDSNGVVTKSVIPAWRVGLLSAYSPNASGTELTVPWDNGSTENNFLSGGITLSSGLITVPVSGIYQINANTRYDNIGSGYIISRIVINNNSAGNRETYVIDGSPDGSYLTLNVNDTYSLSAGDEIRITVYSNVDTSWNIETQSTFSGHLVG